MNYLQFKNCSTDYFPQTSLQEKSAVTFQSLARRMLAIDALTNLKKNYLLNEEVFMDIQPLLNKEILDTLPRATEGNSRNRIRIMDSKGVLVRIAITEEEKENHVLRIGKMRMGRRFILNKNLKHIKISKASLYQDYLVEKLLPLTKGNMFTSIAYYMQKYQLFNPAVVDCTEFLLEIPLEDTHGNSEWMTRTFPVGVPRYDNVALYEKNKNGNIKYLIGLIDLETLNVKPIGKDHFFQTAKKVITLFPLHYDIILETCQKRALFSKLQLEFLNYIKEGALKSFQNTYGVHCDFLLKRADLTTDPLDQFLDSKEEQEQLIQVIEAKIRYWHKFSKFSIYCIDGKDLPEAEKMELDKASVSFKLLGVNPEEMLTCLKQEILCPLIHEVCEFIKQRIAKTKSLSPLTSFQMMSERIGVWRKGSKQKIFTLSERHDDPYKFELKKVMNAPSCIDSIPSKYYEMIVKSHLMTGRTYFMILELLAHEFKNKGIVAEVYKDNNLLTIFF